MSVMNTEEIEDLSTSDFAFLLIPTSKLPD